MTPLSLFAFGEEAVSRAVLLGSVCVATMAKKGKKGAASPSAPTPAPAAGPATPDLVAQGWRRGSAMDNEAARLEAEIAKEREEMLRAKESEGALREERAKVQAELEEFKKLKEQELADATAEREKVLAEAERARADAEAASQKAKRLQDALIATEEEDLEHKTTALQYVD